MMPPLAWLATLFLGLPLLLFVPTHFLLRRFAPQRATLALRQD